MKKIFVLLLVVTVMGSVSPSWAGQVDITTLPGYGVATSSIFNFGPNGWAGWSVPTGKVVLGAQIISTGDTVADFSVFRPAGPGEVFPHYTYGATEYGFVLQSVNASNPGVQMNVFYADPLAGYTIGHKTSGYNNFGPNGWAGWSAPAGNVVSGGGYEFLNGASPVSSQIALENSVWPHYTFGPNEQGWVVQNQNVAGVQGRAYVISFAPVPEPGTMLLLGFGLVGLAGFATRRKK